jgi:hypothetical protein
VRLPVILLVAATVVMAGCGNRRLLLGVDALSFTAPEERVIAFGPVPVLPVPIRTGELPVFADLHVNMIDGTNNVIDVEDVTLTFSAEIADSTGGGLDTMRVYLSDATTDPRTTTPVMVVPVVLVDGQVTPIHAVVAGDPRVIALFTQQEMRVSVTTSLEGPASGAALNGRLTLTELRAAVVARHHTF